MPGQFDLQGRVAIVTGGNGGIGRGIALALAEAGAQVVVAARNEGKTSAVLKELEAIGRSAVGVNCDVNNRASIEAAVQAATGAFGRLDILVNNAGIARGGRPETLPEESWDEVLDTNLKACFVFAQAAHPAMVAAGGGKIINIGSEYSLFGSAGVVSYSASKGGVVQLTKSLAVAWAKDNIQVNCIIPGWIRTDMTAPIYETENRQFYDAIVARTPARRFGEPEECGGAAVFLASAASGFVTGQSIAVDGGYSIA